jgi:DNA (cytosine-5)-methyltransferase 1
MKDTCGLTSGKPFAYFDPDTRSLRTWQGTGLWGSEQFCGTVPKTGSMSGGVLYELPTPEPRIEGSDFSSCLPTPRTSDSTGAGKHGTGGMDLRTAVALLPTPCAQQSGNSPEEHLRKKPGRTQVTDLRVLVEGGLLETGGALLPTPGASDGTGGAAHPDNREGHSRQLIDYALLAGSTAWGKYEPAIRRWEQLTRPAPQPTEPKNGKTRLNAAFSEWMMGLPKGWVTDINIPYGAKLKLLGNGVVPQQAEQALRHLLDIG